MRLKRESIFCLIPAVIVFLIYVHTLDSPWKQFDEQIIYSETILPTPLSFSQLVEYLKYFGINNYFEASNPFYSTIANIRNNPFNNVLTLFVNYVFQKNPFAYHLLSLTLHIINTCIFYLLLNNISLRFSNSNKSRIYLLTILTLIWSLHPANVETVLFATNWPPLLSYTFSLISIYYFLTNCLYKPSVIKSVFIFFLLLISFFTCEYSITTPLIIILYLFSNHLYENKSLKIKESLVFTLKKSIPIIAATILFIILFLIFPTNENIFHNGQSSLTITLQRIFWLSPQIFFHFIKLIIFPLHLSIDQTAMAKLSNSLSNPYSIFCVLFMFLMLLLAFISFLFIRKNIYYFLFITISLFLTALLPFLHIISPVYCLASERYLYFPLLILIFGIAHLLFYLFSDSNKNNKKHLCLFLLSALLIFFGAKTYLRTHDWKNSLTLFESTLKESPNGLFKGLRQEFIGSILLDKGQELKKSGEEYISKGRKTLEEYLIKLESERLKFQDTLPEVIKFYGLDPKTMQAKTAYLIAFTTLHLENDINKALEILKPHMKDLFITDTQILDLYLGLLFTTNNLDEAEKLLNKAVQTRINPIILVILSELYIKKYQDYSKAEIQLKKSFQYFPYDKQTLEALQSFYFRVNKPYEYAYFSYLHGIRTHSVNSLQNAYNVFMKLGIKEMANNALNNIKLIENH